MTQQSPPSSPAIQRHINLDLIDFGPLLAAIEELLSRVATYHDAFEKQKLCDLGRLDLSSRAATQLERVIAIAKRIGLPVTKTDSLSVACSTSEKNETRMDDKLDGVRFLCRGLCQLRAGLPYRVTSHDAGGDHEYLYVEHDERLFDAGSLAEIEHGVSLLRKVAQTAKPGNLAPPASHSTHSHEDVLTFRKSLQQGIGTLRAYKSVGISGLVSERIAIWGDAYGGAAQFGVQHLIPAPPADWREYAVKQANGQADLIDHLGNLVAWCNEELNAKERPPSGRQGDWAYPADFTPQTARLYLVPGYIQPVLDAILKYEDWTKQRGNSAPVVIDGLLTGVHDAALHMMECVTWLVAADAQAQSSYSGLHQLVRVLDVALKRIWQTLASAPHDDPERMDVVGIRPDMEVFSFRTSGAELQWALETIESITGGPANQADGLRLAEESDEMNETHRKAELTGLLAACHRAMECIAVAEVAQQGSGYDSQFAGGRSPASWLAKAVAGDPPATLDQLWEWAWLIGGTDNPPPQQPQLTASVDQTRRAIAELKQWATRLAPTPGRAEGDAGESKQPAKRRKRGRKRLPRAEELRREDLITAWDRFQESKSGDKADFCKDRGIKPKQLDGVLAWKRTRCNRDN